MNSMTPVELAIWSGMAGAILLLTIVAAGDLVASRSVSATRGLAFILLTGSWSILMSGLPAMLMPTLDAQALLPVQASLGPLSGALALTYLGVWVGPASDDRLIRRTVAGGGAALVLAALLLAVIALLEDLWQALDVIAAAAAVNAISVLGAALVAVRSATLGDALARWMAVACIFLAGMVGGLYGKAMQVTGMGLPMWAVTAACTVGYFLIVIALTLQRNRELRRLRRLARSPEHSAWGVDMPVGSQLIPHVDDALWRSARFGRDCVVAAVSVSNLYQLGESAGPGSDQQILMALSARIRRIVGFRNVVGLYHPRCFILVVSAVQDPRRGQLLASTLLQDLRKAVTVGAAQNRQVFEPAIGIGLVRLAGANGDALGAINSAEQLAMQAAHVPSGVIEQDFRRREAT